MKLPILSTEELLLVERSLTYNNLEQQLEDPESLLYLDSSIFHLQNAQNSIKYVEAREILINSDLAYLENVSQAAECDRGPNERKIFFTEKTIRAYFEQNEKPVQRRITSVAPYKNPLVNEEGPQQQKETLIHKVERLENMKVKLSTVIKAHTELSNEVDSLRFEIREML